MKNKTLFKRWVESFVFFYVPYNLIFGVGHLVAFLINGHGMDFDTFQACFYCSLMFALIFGTLDSFLE